jgi:hypothetical protein
MTTPHAPGPRAVLCTVFAVFVYVAGPAFLVRVLSWFHPKGDNRRELIDTLRLLPARKRLVWAMGQIEPALCEGLPTRLSALRSTAEHRGRERAKRRAELEDAEAELKHLIAEFAHPTVVRFHHAPQRRQTLLPAFLLATIGAALAGLAVTPRGVPLPAPTIAMDWGHASTTHVVVAVSIAVLAVLVVAVGHLGYRRASRRRELFAALAVARRARATGQRPPAALVLRYQ